jgi:quercetin dioxygenase-like cupin family protein
VAIGVERDRGLRVPCPGSYHMHRHAALEQERKVGVPQTVERDGFDADRLIAKRLGEWIQVHHITERGRKYKFCEIERLKLICARDDCTSETIIDEEMIMGDTTIKKVEAGSSPRGEMGQKYLVAGKHVSMRLWVDEPGGKLKAPTSRDYETVGYVISGSAKLDLEGQTLNLKAGDSWLVPAGASHHYTITEPFTAIEATAPPAEVHGRDTAWTASRWSMLARQTSGIDPPNPWCAALWL